MTKETFLRFAPPLLAVLVSVPATMYLTDRNNERNENRKHSVALSDVDKQRRSEFTALVNQMSSECHGDDEQQFQDDARKFLRIIDGGQSDSAIGIQWILGLENKDLQLIVRAAMYSMRAYLDHCPIGKAGYKGNGEKGCVLERKTYVIHSLDALQESISVHQSIRNSSDGHQ